MYSLTYTENYGSVIRKCIETGVAYDIEKSVNKGNEYNMPQLNKISFRNFENKEIWIINIFIRIVGYGQYSRNYSSGYEGHYEISIIDNYGLVHRQPQHGIQQSELYNSGHLIFTNSWFNIMMYKDLEPLPDQFIDIIKSYNLYTHYPNNFNKVFSDLKLFLNTIKDIEDSEDAEYLDDFKPLPLIPDGLITWRTDKKSALLGGKKSRKDKRKHKNKKTQKNKRKQKYKK
jgi:hypothetical protein